MCCLCYMSIQVIKENTDNREDNRNRPHDPISEHMLQLMMQHLRRTEVLQSADFVFYHTVCFSMLQVLSMHAM